MLVGRVWLEVLIHIFLRYTNRSKLVFVILLIFMKMEHANSLHRKKDDTKKICKMDVIKPCFLYSLD